MVTKWVAIIETTDSHVPPNILNACMSNSQPVDVNWVNLS